MVWKDMELVINRMEDENLKDMLTYCLENNVTYMFELENYARQNKKKKWIKLLNQKMTRHHVRSILGIIRQHETEMMIMKVEQEENESWNIDFSTPLLNF